MRVKYSTYYKVKKENKLLKRKIDMLEELILQKTGKSVLRHCLNDLANIVASKPNSNFRITNLRIPKEYE